MLVVGDSKAGRSRTAYEAARRLTITGHPHDPLAVIVDVLVEDVSGVRCGFLLRDAGRRLRVQPGQRRTRG